MATFQASTTFGLMGLSDQMRFHKGIITATTNNAPKVLVSPLSLPKLPTRSLVVDLDMKSNGFTIPNTTQNDEEYNSNSAINSNGTNSTKHSANLSDDTVLISELYAIMEAVADRVEMHKNIGAQRDNWNHLLLMSINTITLTAATMAAIAGSTNSVISDGGAPFLALKLSSTILYVAATGMSVVMNKIQPSQLAEEQRNAARLFNQLHVQIQTALSLGSGSSTIMDVNEAIEKVLALDRAYPLPLLGEMLDKFPKTVEPAIWWPKQNQRKMLHGVEGRSVDGNGWSEKLEEEMREIVEVLKNKDVTEYLKLTEKALKINRVLAFSGPLLTGIAALGSAFVGTSSALGAWGVMLGVIGGALASVVNTMEHGGQVGMVVEMYRSNAGFFRLMQETIESNVNEKQVERRENGQVFEMKVALQLGRSLSELKFGEASHQKFASKLF